MDGQYDCLQEVSIHDKIIDGSLILSIKEQSRLKKLQE